MSDWDDLLDRADREIAKRYGYLTTVEELVVALRTTIAERDETREVLALVTAYARALAPTADEVKR